MHSNLPTPHIEPALTALKSILASLLGPPATSVAAVGAYEGHMTGIVRLSVLLPAGIDQTILEAIPPRVLGHQVEVWVQCAPGSEEPLGNVSFLRSFWQ